MIDKNARIGIIGAGTTGVYLASLLHKQGYQVDLFEKASSPRTNGCGILLVQDGMKALADGNPSVCKKIIKAGSPVTCFEFRNLKGGLANSNFVNYQDDELPAMLVHRQAILEALLEDLPSPCLHNNHPLISLEQNEQKVTAYFAHGQQWEGDLLIGVDGIFSRVRSFIVPNQKHLFYLGDLVWRGIVHDDSFCPEGNFIVYMRGRGIYANFFSLGNGKTHWGFFTEKEQTETEKNKPRPHDILIPESELAKLPPEPRKLIQSTPIEDIFCNFSYDINPLPYLYQGRVVLMGDAGHASSSTKARGMTSGFEDALSLARHFATGNELDQVLFNFQQERLPIVHDYQRSSREMSLNIGRQQRRKAA
jgi:2-polyprenyl-6-methoxyphenol hydroxylase-like FAD-dependent oxidoreductase